MTPAVCRALPNCIAPHFVSFPPSSFLPSKGGAGAPPRGTTTRQFYLSLSYRGGVTFPVAPHCSANFRREFFFLPLLDPLFGRLFFFFPSVLFYTHTNFGSAINPSPTNSLSWRRLSSCRQKKRALFCTSLLLYPQPKKKEKHPAKATFTHHGQVEAYPAARGQPGP